MVTWHTHTHTETYMSCRWRKQREREVEEEEDGARHRGVPSPSKPCSLLHLPPQPYTLPLSLISSLSSPKWVCTSQGCAATHPLHWLTWCVCEEGGVTVLVHSDVGWEPFQKTQCDSLMGLLRTLKGEWNESPALVLVIHSSWLTETCFIFSCCMSLCVCARMKESSVLVWSWKWCSREGVGGGVAKWAHHRSI